RGPVALRQPPAQLRRGGVAHGLVDHQRGLPLRRRRDQLASEQSHQRILPLDTPVDTPADPTPSSERGCSTSGTRVTCPGPLVDTGGVTPMIVIGRAGASVLMLAGFYVVALIQLGAAIALAVWLSSVSTGVPALKIALPRFPAPAGAVAVAIWKAIRAKPRPPKGLTVGSDQAPALWTTVRELANEAGTRVPDEIRLVPDVNAAV